MPMTDVQRAQRQARVRERVRARGGLATTYRVTVEEAGREPIVADWAYLHEAKAFRDMRLGWLASQGLVRVNGDVLAVEMAGVGRFVTVRLTAVRGEAQP